MVGRRQRIFEGTSSLTLAALFSPSAANPTAGPAQPFCQVFPPTCVERRKRRVVMLGVGNRRRVGFVPCGPRYTELLIDPHSVCDGVYPIVQTCCLDSARGQSAKPRSGPHALRRPPGRPPRVSARDYGVLAQLSVIASSGPAAGVARRASRSDPRRTHTTACRSRAARRRSSCPLP